MSARFSRNGAPPFPIRKGRRSQVSVPVTGSVPTLRFAESFRFLPSTSSVFLPVRTSLSKHQVNTPSITTTRRLPDCPPRPPGAPTSSTYRLITRLPHPSVPSLLPSSSPLTGQPETRACTRDTASPSIFPRVTYIHTANPSPHPGECSHPPLRHPTCPQRAHRRANISARRRD